MSNIRTVHWVYFKCVLCTMNVCELDVPYGDSTLPCHSCGDEMKRLLAIIEHFDTAPCIDGVKKFIDFAMPLFKDSW